MGWHFDSDRPIYTQLAEHIQFQIAAGVYLPGSKLPSVRDLAAEAEVNPNTMQRALAQLETEGLAVGSRTAGRTVTEDTAVIEAAARERARAAVAACLRILAELGYSPENALVFVKEELSNE